MASHTVSHPPLDSIEVDGVRDELTRSKAILDSLFSGEPVVSLAYPFSRTNAAVAEVARSVYESARGGQPGDGSALHNDPATLDFMSLKGFFPCGTVEEWHGAVEQTLSGRGWLIESLHPIDEPGYCEVRSESFAEHLDYLSRQGQDLWVAPVRDVVRRIRQWRALEIETRRASEDEYQLRISGAHEHQTDWQVVLYVDDPDRWQLVDNDGRILSVDVEGDALAFSWPRDRTKDTLLLARKEKTGVSPFSWGRLKKAVLEEVRN